jgi:DNA-binding NtrC family response regulator
VRNVAVDVRVVAATRRDLHAAVASSEFREDLFYRLNVFAIGLPPLRERTADIPLLVERALATLRRSRPRLSCSPLALRALRAYAWPGNVRELLAALESAAIRTDSDRIEAQHLPREVRDRSEQNGGNGSNGERYRATEPTDERAAIIAALDAAGGSRARAAALLGMGRTTLWRKMKLYGIEHATEL